MADLVRCALLEILLPQLPRDLSLELDIKADRMVLNLSASESVDHVVFAAELGAAGSCAPRWIHRR